MLRKFIFKAPDGVALVLPVTPKGYQIEHGRKANALDMYLAGQVNLPGSQVLLDETIECLLPAQNYPFVIPGAVLDPWYYISRLQRWSEEGTVLRFIVSDTPVNKAVILDPILYREQDGTNDLYCTIPMRGYRDLAVMEYVQLQTGNAFRAVDAEPEMPSTYIVAAGDTLLGIARRFYGDSSLYVKLAAVNGIKNVNLIQVGQKLKLPPIAELKAVSANASESGKVTPKPEASDDGGIWLKITFVGDQEYYGRAIINFVGSGKSGKMELSQSSRIGILKVPKGATVTVRLDEQKGHRAAYKTINGVGSRITGALIILKPNEDTDLLIRWEK